MEFVTVGLMKKRIALSAFLLLFAATVSAQGPYAAQIQRALTSFLAQAHTWTGVQTLTAPTLTDPVTSYTPVGTGSLPACAAGTANTIRFVNDALTPALGVGLSAGGALTVGVICKSGTGWIVF